MTSAAMFSYLLQTTLAVSLLSGLVLLIRQPFAKAFGANTAYALWAIPMARLFLPPLPANWTLFGAFSLDDASQNAPPAIQVLDPVTLSQLALPSVPAPHAVAADISLWSQLEAALPPLVPSLLVIWGLGALYVFAMLMARQISTSRMIKAEARDAGPLLQTRAMDIRAALGVSPQTTIAVQTSLISSSPLVAGLVRPVVLLPEWFDDDYTEDEQRLAIMHEMMHIKRRDLWALFAASFAVSLQWFNPVIWMSLSAFRRDQEAACDADILGLGNISPHNYGATLVKAVRKSTPVAQPIQGASLGLNHALYERLTKMKNPLPNANKRKTGTLLLSGVGAAALLLSACAASQAQTTELDGAPEDQSRVVVRTIVVDDEATLDGAAAEPNAHVRIIKRSEDGSNGEQVQVFNFETDENTNGSQAGQTVFFASTGDANNNAEITALAREFSEEFRRLHSAEGDNSAELEALQADFETKIETLVEDQHGDANVRVVEIENGIEWHGETEAHTDCADGEGQTRTVVIERDGERSEQVFSSCGTTHVSFDTGEIMAGLRESGQLTEERLAEIETKLEEAKVKLAELDFDGDFDFDFDFDFDEDSSQTETGED
ncbi:MAG: M56 family metallopeptidase [Hyphomonadaceae bacterium]